MSDAVLRARGLRKRFRGRRVLDALDLELRRGAVTVLLGRNGAGKSTLLKLALGVLKPDGGSIQVCGHDPARRPRVVRQRLGYVPDKPDVYDWMTPAELYRFLKPQYPTWNDDLVARTVASLRVPAQTPFGALSRGEGMKAMLVAALAPEPELLLLDEPLAGLDPVARDEVLCGVIGEIRAEERTVLCTTHDRDVAARIADRVALLSCGKIARHGATAEVLGDETAAPQRLRELLAEVPA